MHASFGSDVPVSESRRLRALAQAVGDGALPAGLADLRDQTASLSRITMKARGYRVEIGETLRALWADVGPDEPWTNGLVDYLACDPIARTRVNGPGPVARGARRRRLEDACAAGTRRRSLRRPPLARIGLVARTRDRS